MFVIKFRCGIGVFALVMTRFILRGYATVADGLIEDA